MGSIEFGLTDFATKDIYVDFLRVSTYAYEEHNIKFDYSYLSNEIDALRIQYDIEKLRGKTEFETFVNATRWVAQILSNDLPPLESQSRVKDMIADISGGKYGASCYTYACVLNEVFRALGYLSRIIFCLPIDFHPYGSHVVNIVYSEECDKWLLFDAAHGVYFQDDAGMILNLQELRDYFVSKKSINVSLIDGIRDTVSGRERHFLAQRILIYMSKHVYRFRCFENSYKDNFAQNRIVNAVNLIPCNYLAATSKIVRYYYETNTKQVEIFISNPLEFWKLPD